MFWRQRRSWATLTVITATGHQAVPVRHAGQPPYASQAGHGAAGSVQHTPPGCAGVQDLPSVQSNTPGAAPAQAAVLRSITVLRNSQGPDGSTPSVHDPLLTGSALLSVHSSQLCHQVTPTLRHRTRSITVAATPGCHAQTILIMCWWPSVFMAL